MSAAIVVPPGSGEPSQRKRFTRGEVQRMGDSGLFAGQRLELIEGDLIDKMGQKPPHAFTIRMLQALMAALFGSERIQAQLPIEVQTGDQEWNLPEPDVAILKEAKAEFQTRYPRGTELLLIIEVADSTVQHDFDHETGLICPRRGLRVLGLGSEAKVFDCSSAAQWRQVRRHRCVD